MVTIYENKEKDTKDGEDEILEIIPKKLKQKTKTKKKGNFSDFTETFLDNWESALTSQEQVVGQKIGFSGVFGSLARAYERIRTTVEYKGEHVLRRNAIERILKRLIWEHESIRANLDLERVAENLIKELIWARYLPNNSIPQKAVIDVQKVIEKYVYLIKNLDNIPKGLSTSSIRTWVWGIASSELEDLLDPSNREMFVWLMYEWFSKYYVWKDNIDEHEKEIQLYLAIHRAYMKSDEPIMRYHLLIKEFPRWSNADKEQVNSFILKFPQIYEEIEKHIGFTGRFALYRKVQREVAAFEIFHEIARKKGKDLRGLLKNQNIFSKEIIDVCEAKYKQVRKKVSTGIVRSIIYIFLTKVFLALLIEVPYEILMFDDIRYIPLGINIMLPPFMMWLIGLTIRIPGAKNTQSIVNRLTTVVYTTPKDTKNEFSLVIKTKRSTLSQIFGLLYALLFIGVFGGISYLLLKIQFTVIGIGIFFVFLSLVLLFAYKIRFNANEIKVDTDDEGFIDHILSFLALPFLNLGFYISRGFAKFNFLTIILDFLIEAPLKSVIEIFEEWTSFLKRKKEEVVEVPE